MAAAIPAARSLMNGGATVTQGCGAPGAALIRQSNDWGSRAGLEPAKSTPMMMARVELERQRARLSTPRSARSRTMAGEEPSGEYRSASTGSIDLRILAIAARYLVEAR